MTTTSTARPRRVTIAAIAIAASLVTVVFTATNLLIDATPHLADGTVPDSAYVRNYVLHPVPAAFHIILGLTFVVGGLFQVSARFRRRHLALHRRMGRVLIPAGMLSAVAALYVGLDHPFNGLAESSATVVFAGWMLWSLIAAFLAIRRRDVVQHRRWMIRALVVALGIGTVRAWTGLFIAIHSIQAGGPPPDMHPRQATFGLAFWLGFGMNAVLAEWWLRRERSGAPVQPAHPGRSPHPSGHGPQTHG